MVGNKNLGNASIINAECMALRNRIIAAKLNEILNLEIKKRL